MGERGEGKCVYIKRAMIVDEMIRNKLETKTAARNSRKKRLGGKTSRE
jgi:hypothetical protein